MAADRQRRLLDVLRCPSCRGAVQVHRHVWTVDGRTKTGTLECEHCRSEVAGIDSFQVTFSEVEPVPHRTGEPNGSDAGDIGEWRISGFNDVVLAAGWDIGSDHWTSGKVGATLSLRGPFTDARLRVVDHERGAVIDVTLDGAPVGQLDTRHSPGSVSHMVDIATDLELATHELQFTVAHLEPGGYALVQELVLFGPRQPDLPFGAPSPFKRGNPYSPRILDYLDRCTPQQLILECGGGDSRSERSNQINLEYLPYEGPDLRADIHRLPFEDGTFDLVLNQAVLEHLAQPRLAAEEMIRVCKPGGHILTEVAFMQPVHAVPYHFYNMTQWGTEELFKDTCEIVESDWFGDLSFTMDWLLDAAGITEKMDPATRDDWRRRFASLDELVDHRSLQSVASGIWVVAKKR